ncbi:hypothetical protein RF11_11914 [Thelohanellus kitauei]|uniref:Uncharacterized protein n=1 Tax=Thelohanellus kitauei TaxID=669202 RepID=A0A0C2NAZ9_THEKT|nr:hypothetical protein RF11_11914 [Thelohanellus kitauei]
MISRDYRNINRWQQDPRPPSKALWLLKLPLGARQICPTSSRPDGVDAVWILVVRATLPMPEVPKRLPRRSSPGPQQKSHYTSKHYVARVIHPPAISAAAYFSGKGCLSGQGPLPRP